jgi:hypothetical protein
VVRQPFHDGYSNDMKLAIFGTLGAPSFITPGSDDLAHVQAGMCIPDLAKIEYAPVESITADL